MSHAIRVAWVTADDPLCSAMPHVTTIYDEKTLERVEALAQRLSKNAQPGVTQVSRSEAIRAAVLRGLAELEKELSK